MKKWIYAARLRTLPLSLSGVLLGFLLALGKGIFDPRILVLSILSTLSLQILANFANDYGDGIKGVDKDRIGPKRAIASGMISVNSMKKAIVLFSISSFLFAFFLISISFDKLNIYFFIFSLLIIACIYAAINYAIGIKAYGYKAAGGDISVFLFFGWISVMGSYFLYTHYFDTRILLPASALGLLSVAVLNLNNMRDIENDKKSGKNTLVVKIGLSKAKIYHSFLILMPFLLSFLFVIFSYRSMFQYLFLILLLPCVSHLREIYPITDLKKFDKELKKIALLTFFYAILIGTSELF